MKLVVVVTQTPTVYCHLYMANSSFWLICLVYVCLNFDYTQMIILMQWGLAMLIGICDWIIFHNWCVAFVMPNRFLNNAIYWHGSVPIWIKFQRIAFFNKHNLFYKYQFGFRKRHGTDIALIVLIDKIMSALNEGDYVLGVFLDLSKAFDTVDHNNQRSCLWLDQELSWVENVSFNKHDSSTMDIKCGVPQGSILGPLLFLIYVNDLSNVSSILFTFIVYRWYQCLCYLEKSIKFIYNNE